jgi:hypothetical protein
MGLGPLGPIGPTSPPGSVKPNRLRSGSVNRPSPAPSRSSLSARAHWRYLGRRCCRLAIPIDPGELRCHHLGRNTSLFTLSRLHQADLSPAPTSRRSTMRSHSGTRLSAAAALGLSPAFSWCQLRSLRWPWCGCAAVMWLVAEQARVEAAQVGLLLVPPLLLRWSLPQVALGWPREHCLAMPAR